MSTENILIQVAFADRTRYYAKKTTTVFSKQYKGRILSISLNRPGSRGGEYETTGGTVTLKDPNGEIRALLADPATKYIKGRKIRLYQSDRTLIMATIIMSVSYGIDTVTFGFSDRFEALEVKSHVNRWQLISRIHPGAPQESRTKAYNWFTGPFATWGAPLEKNQNYLPAQRITGNLYILGEPGARTALTVGSPGSLQLVTKPDNTVITSSCTLSLSSVGIYYITYTGAAEEYLKVNFTLTTPIAVEDMVNDISDRYFVNIPLETSVLSLFGYAFNQYHADPVPSLDNTYLDRHYCVDELTSGKNILRDVAQSLYLEFFLNENGELEFFDVYGELRKKSGEIPAIQPAKSRKFYPTGNQDTDDEQINIAVTNYGYQFDGGSFEDEKEFPNNQSREIINYDITKDRPYKMIGTGDDTSIYGAAAPTAPLMVSHAHAATLRELKEKKYNTKERSFQVPLRYCIDWQPFDLVKFKHRIFEDNEFHILMIRRISFSDFSSPATVEFIDLVDFENFSEWMTLSLESDQGYNNSIFLDESNRGFSFATAASTTLQHDVADNDGYYRSSINFQGVANSDYLHFGNTERYQYFDPWHKELVLPDFCIWAKVKFPNANGAEYICGCWADNVDNYWTLFKRSTAAGSKVRFVQRSGGVTNVALESVRAITDTNWHVVVFAKIGSNYAIYIDGAQEAYVSGVSANIQAGLTIGAQWTGSAFAAFADMKLTYLRFYFDRYGPLTTPLTPNASLTDNHAVPTDRLGDSRGITY